MEYLGGDKLGKFDRKNTLTFSPGLRSTVANADFFFPTSVTKLFKCLLQLEDMANFCWGCNFCPAVFTPTSVRITPLHYGCWHDLWRISPAPLINWCTDAGRGLPFFFFCNICDILQPSFVIHHRRVFHNDVTGPLG